MPHAHDAEAMAILACPLKGKYAREVLVSIEEFGKSQQENVWLVCAESPSGIFLSRENRL